MAPISPAGGGPRSRGAGASLLLAALLVLSGCAAQTAEQKARAAAPPDLAVRYVCNDGTRFTARFVFAEPRQVVLERHGRAPLMLARQEAESGFRYADEGSALAGHDERAEWTEAGRPPANCVTKNPPPPYFPGTALTRPAR